MLFDENLPEQIGRELIGHDVSSVEQEGWKGARNGRLLALAAQTFEVLVTADFGLSFQNELVGRGLSVVVLPTNRLPILREHPIPLQRTLDELAGFGRVCIIRIGWDGRRVRRWLDQGAAEEEIAPVPPFRGPRG